MYEHVLQRSAFNMTLGPFGHVKGKDFICIQALDGTLSFYEQESFAFSRFLPNYLLPGPFRYDSINDSFIVATASRTIESYRYHILAIAKDDEDSSGNKRTHGPVKNIINRGRRVAPDWMCMIGENALDIAIIENTNPCTIIVLGEHNLFIMDETGELKYSRKFDFNPLCMCSYILPNAQVMMLIVSEYNSLLVFNYTRIKWIAQMSCKAICIQRGTINNSPGILTCLSDTGDLTSFYLGTNPSFSFTNITPSFHEINFDKSSQELKSLRKIIKSFTNSHNSVSSKSSLKHSSDVDIKVIINDIDINQDEYTGKMNCLLKVTIYTGNNKLTNLRVSSTLSKPLTVDRSLIIIEYIDRESSHDIKVTISSDKNLTFLPSDLDIKISIIYHLASAVNVARVKQIDHQLPLSLLATPTSNVINVPLKYSFSLDIINSPGLSLDQVISFNTPGDDITLQITVNEVNTFSSITLVSRKMLDKLIFKSSSYECLNLIILYVLQRCSALNCKFDVASIDKNSLSLTNFYQLIDEYASCRDKLCACDGDLEKQSAYFKCIIKRILIKLKDRNPSSLNQLDVMLDRINSKLSSLTDQQIDLQRNIIGVTNNLHATGTVIARLLAIVTGMKNEQAAHLRHIFATDDYCDIKRVSLTQFIIQFNH